MVFGKKQCVNQLGFPARKLPNDDGGERVILEHGQCSLNDLADFWIVKFAFKVPTLKREQFAGEIFPVLFVPS
ncbi:hypothetical protein GCM10007877_27760 [Marinibactrum halimedae]|uniref:Uncharacterized protein n=1 Tax=Marinibactrum halimedae TaxID=1444977 RepID=A0AA37TD36_9GAMM|nr:hypothetical protein GCM10007877_27760 [Marinibactrum halimedae]